jgi:two-component sensor histidine kinase
MNELLSNALKHAVSGRQRAHIGVAFHRRDGGIELVVTDDGDGLPEGFRVEACRSLGLQIVTALVRQVGGRLSFGSGPGTTATVWVPIAAARS